MDISNPRAERALLLAATGDERFTANVIERRETHPTGELPGWYDATAPGLVDLTAERAVALASSILDLAMLTDRLDGRARRELSGGIRHLLRTARCAHASCCALAPVAERVDGLRDLP